MELCPWGETSPSRAVRTASALSAPVEQHLTSLHDAADARTDGGTRYIIGGIKEALMIDGDDIYSCLTRTLDALMPQIGLLHILQRMGTEMKAFDIANLLRYNTRGTAGTEKRTQPW